MIQVKNISKSYGPRTVLSDISFTLGDQQRAALVGANGVGKSTLLRIIAGLETADLGNIELSKNARIGYLPQDPQTNSAQTVHGYLKEVAGLSTIDAQMDDLSDKLDISNLEKYESLREQYEYLGGYNFNHRFKAILAGFGLVQFGERLIDSLSGGQRMKVVLTGILLKGVDILLLDEPTNNLDLPSLVWLENFLAKSSATCLVVSHDRRFLDQAVNRVLEIDWHSHELTTFTGSYSEFIVEKARARTRQLEEFERQREEVDRLEKAASEQRRWASRGAVQVRSDNDKFGRGVRRDRAAKSAQRAKNLETKIEQMRKVDKPLERVPLIIPLDPGAERLGAIELRDVVAGYDNFKVGPVTLSVPFGTRIGIVGANGSGKSTLLRAIAGDLKPISGTVSLGRGYRLGNLIQSHDSLPRGKSPLDYLKDGANLDDERAHWLLNRFGIDQSRFRSALGEISPGERARLLLALFSVKAVNLLLLDEPTNHLDVEALDALEEVLESYQGTIVLVSHDRYFLDKSQPSFTYLMKEGKLEKIESWRGYEQTIEQDVQRMLRLL